MVKSETAPFNNVIWNIVASFGKKPVEESVGPYAEVRKCSFFDPVPDQHLSLLVEQAAIRKFASGANITTERTPGNSLFVLLSGTATIFANGMHMGVIQRGDCIGECVFFADQHSCPATVIANGGVIVLELTKQAVDGLSDEVRICMDKALLQALFKKLQRSNILNELMHKQWVASLCRQA